MSEFLLEKVVKIRNLGYNKLTIPVNSRREFSNGLFPGIPGGFE